jgi:tRNA(fMet)-specific endonuclease VapC
VEWIDELDPGMVYLSVITVGEIQKGVAKLEPSKRRDAIQEWLETELLLRFEGRIVEITVPVMMAWGELVGRLEKQGRPLNAIDSLIAAIALEGEYSLVTRNERDFENTGVKIVNPWE